MANIRSATSVDAYIGEKIRGYRNRLKISQEELGVRLGVSFQQVQKYEKGVNRVTGGRLTQLAEAFNCHVSDLLPETKVKKSKGMTSLERIVQTRDGMKLVDSFVSIKNETMRAAVVELARRFEGQ